MNKASNQDIKNLDMFRDRNTHRTRQLSNKCSRVSDTGKLYRRENSIKTLFVTETNLEAKSGKLVLVNQSFQSVSVRFGCQRSKRYLNIFSELCKQIMRKPSPIR